MSIDFFKKLRIFVLIGLLVACTELPERPDDSEFNNICDPRNFSAINQFPFYIYRDAGSNENHYSLTHVNHNNFTNISIDTTSSDFPLVGSTTCIKITWPSTNINEDTLAHWYWLEPKGYNLSKAKRVSFKARGAVGGEKVAFIIGGLIDSTYFLFTDTVNGTSIPYKKYPLPLERHWVEYTINTEFLEPSLCRVVGGFSFQLRRSFNQSAITFYIDEIRYE